MVVEEGRGGAASVGTCGGGVDAVLAGAEAGGGPAAEGLGLAFFL